MKNLITALCIFVFVDGFTQPLNRSFENSDGKLKLLGQATVDRLKEDPFQEWYLTNYHPYDVDKEILGTIDLPDSITIFMGTWCGDSRREVPRFVKILENSPFDMSKLKIICLNSGFQNYKQSPEREERGVNIHRVPTFILHNFDGSEVGRIVEEPVKTLEADLQTIMHGEEYFTAYPAVADLLTEFEKNSPKELRRKQSKLKEKYETIVTSEHELNTYGYVLWTSFDLKKAEFVFELNTKLFPNLVTPHRTLARFKRMMGLKKEALVSVKRGLKIDPENEGLIELQERISTR